ncbi:hypothetical protein, partial [Paenibacillus sp. HB172176]|uniref:hypothetical protein n=1 Tax=Paenibacillus sp. HB172176 TaxID=2493690 RepID=UPI00143C3DD9
DFDIVPSVIEYRDSFSFVPKDFVMNGCAYQSHQYKIERNGTYITKDIKGMDKTTTYTRSNYPWLIGVGDHTVSIKIKTSCGESDWMGQKTLTVTDMGDNHPPQFKVGFVSPYNRTTPLTEVVEGTTLDLVYIDDPSVPTPTDPDGDLIYFMGFDTDGSSQEFVRAIPSNSQEYTDGFHGIVMDTLGFFSVSAQMRDEFGLTAKASTYIHVVPK